MLVFETKFGNYIDMGMNFGIVFFDCVILRKSYKIGVTVLLFIK